jgi:hypothetical protein
MRVIIKIFNTFSSMVKEINEAFLNAPQWVFSASTMNAVAYPLLSLQEISCQPLECLTIPIASRG